MFVLFVVGTNTKTCRFDGKGGGAGEVCGRIYGLHNGFVMLGADKKSASDKRASAGRRAITLQNGIFVLLDIRG